MINEKELLDFNVAIDKIKLQLSKCLKDSIKYYDALTIKYSRIATTIIFIRITSSLCENIQKMAESYPDYEKDQSSKDFNTLATSAMIILDELAENMTKMYIVSECAKDKIDTKETKDIN
jgi:hypothetical protein